MERICDVIEESIRVKQAILKDEKLLQTIEQIVQICVKQFQQGHKVLLCGNGGSAADAQHIAAELSGKFYLNRSPLFAEALHLNPSYITAVANDFSYEHIFERAVQAKGIKGDILIGLSTSGNSPNISRALAQAQQQGMITIGFTGQTGGIVKKHCDFLLNVPSEDTPRIQESHIMIGHIICELVESRLFG